MVFVTQRYRYPKNRKIITGIKFFTFSSFEQTKIFHQKYDTGIYLTQKN